MIIAEHADDKTISILASSPTLRLTYELGASNMAKSMDILRARRDFSEKLDEVFQDLATIAGADKAETLSNDSLVEFGLWYLAKSSFHSDLSEALELL